MKPTLPRILCRTAALPLCFALSVTAPLSFALADGASSDAAAAVRAPVTRTPVTRDESSAPSTAASPSAKAEKSVSEMLAQGSAAAVRGDFALAALHFFEAENAAEPSTDGSESAGEDSEKRLRAEVELAHSLLALGLFDAAMRQYDYVLRAGENHPAFVEAAEGIQLVSELTGEDVFTTAILDREYGASFARLPAHALDAVNLAMGTSALRGGRAEESDGFLKSIPSDSPLFPRAAYLRGVAAARALRHEDALSLFDASLASLDKHAAAPGRAASILPTAFATAPALAAREAAKARVKMPGRGGISAADLRELAVLARARTLYALGRFGPSSMAYETIPRFSRFWEEALFEGAWARMQNGDDGGALGSLLALHSPQFAASFQPESWILGATIGFERCLFDEARADLASLKRIYGPQHEALKKFLREGSQKPGDSTPPHSHSALLGGVVRVTLTVTQREEPSSPDFWISAVTKPDSPLSEAIRREVTRSQRYASMVRSLNRIEDERQSLGAVEVWNTERPPEGIRPETSGKLTRELYERLNENRDILKRVLADFIRRRLADADARLDDFAARAEILELELQRIETLQLEAHFDQPSHLASQTLGRPKQGEDEIYWPADGEFWADEIGRYQFTLKDGCAPSPKDSKK